jgi:cobalamin biosynthesis Mg chelatase CobN
MTGTRRLSAPIGGRRLLVVSVLALLAFACLPVLAQADSSGIQYEDATPTATHHGSQIPSGSGGSPAHSSGANGGNSTSGGSKHSGSSEGSPKEGESTATGGGSAKNGNGGGGGKAQGSPGKASSQHGGKGAKPLGTNAAKQESDGGASSPLVPILIAIAILAAISIGVVAMRQRRKRGGEPDARVSPEAS